MDKELGSVFNDLIDIKNLVLTRLEGLKIAQDTYNKDPSNKSADKDFKVMMHGPNHANYDAVLMRLLNIKYKKE